MRFDLKTPGASAEEAVGAGARAARREQARGWLAALGGAANLLAVDACTTRLRLVVARPGAVDDAALKPLGARGLVRPSPQALQVVLGPIADQLAGELREALSGASAAPIVRNAHIPAEAPAGAAMAAPAAADSAWSERGVQLLAALGGKANVERVDAASTRLRVHVADAARVDAHAIGVLGARGVALPAPGVVHIIVGPEAAAAAVALRHLLT